MEPSSLLELAERVRAALRAKESGKYTIGDVRAFTEDEALTIIDALEYCAEIAEVPESATEEGMHDDRYVYFVRRIKTLQSDEQTITAIDDIQKMIDNGICFIDDKYFSVVAFDKKKGRTVPVF